jgi:class 3 adenylate cyclase
VDVARFRAAGNHPACRRNRAHNGYVYKMIGDAFQIAFDTALDALAAAIEAQRALYAERWGEFGPLRVRMALHTGVTEERSDDYVGPVLNRLGRLLSVSRGGQILLTQATYELVCDYLPEGAGLCVIWARIA